MKSDAGLLEKEAKPHKQLVQSIPILKKDLSVQKFISMMISKNMKLNNRSKQKVFTNNAVKITRFWMVISFSSSSMLQPRKRNEIKPHN